MSEGVKILLGVISVVVFAAFIICVSMALGPQWNVYSQRLAGEAELKKAESNRKIAILEAEAKLEAASKLASAEVERAKGVAEANRIIGNSLHENADYLKYLWIHEVGAQPGSIIYVPTEAGLPILESGKR